MPIQNTLDEMSWEQRFMAAWNALLIEQHRRTVAEETVRQLQQKLGCNLAQVGLVQAQQKRPKEKKSEYRSHRPSPRPDTAVAA